MTLHTYLYPEHQALKARLVPFAGWDMPLHYGSQIEEHHAVRRDAGLFDVSHMAIIDVRGTHAAPFLQKLLAADVARLTVPGKALYSCMLQEHGGILDDLIVYYLSNTWYRLVVNAATADSDLTWIQSQVQSFNVEINRRPDLSLLSLQGPQAQAKLLPQLPAALQETVATLPVFSAVTQNDWFIGRTGYTGEDGFELMLPHELAISLWRKLLAPTPSSLDKGGLRGVQPCGLGCRDTLRLEAGMNLYGTDMDANTTPLECGLAWTVHWLPETRNFIGRAALEAQKIRGDLPNWVGLISEGRGVLRNHLSVLQNEQLIGVITSGSFSPTLKRAIALARLNVKLEPSLQVEVPGQPKPLQVVKPPFVRNGQPVFKPMVF